MIIHDYKEKADKGLDIKCTSERHMDWEWKSEVKLVKTPWYLSAGNLNAKKRVTFD